MDHEHIYTIIANNIKRITKEKGYSEVVLYALFANTLKLDSYDIARLLYPTKKQHCLLSPNQLETIAEWLSVDKWELIKENEIMEKLTNEEKMILVKNANVDIDILNRVMKNQNKAMIDPTLDNINKTIKILNNN
jgi:hypothetical protein